MPTANRLITVLAVKRLVELDYGSLICVLNHAEIPWVQIPEQPIKLRLWLFMVECSIAIVVRLSE